MAECACHLGPEIPLPVIDVDDELAVSSPDDADHIIDHVLDATEGIDAMREIDFLLPGIASDNRAEASTTAPLLDNSAARYRPASHDRAHEPVDDSAGDACP